MVSEFLNITCLNCVDSGSNWLYGTVDKISFTSSKLLYILNSFSIFDESFNFNFFSTWTSLFFINDNQLFYSFFLDFFNELNFVKLPFLDEWYKNIFNSLISNPLYLEHPELLFVKANILNSEYLYSLGSLYTSLYTNVIYESFNFIIFSVLHYTIFCLILSLIFTLYFSTYTTLYDESTVDLDYSATSLLIEAEKEISSIDDLILFSVCVFYIFGWFFYLNVFTFFSTRIYTASILMLLPFFFLLLLECLLF